METPEVITTNSETGTPPQNDGALATEPTSQGAVQPQGTEQPTVDGSVQPTSSEPAARPRASDHYRERKQKREYAALVERLNRLEQENQALRKPAVAPQEISQEALEDMRFNDPLKYVDITRKQMEEQFNKKLEELTSNLPKHIEQIKAREEFTRREQEALDKLFPTTPGARNETLEDRIYRNEEHLNRIGGIVDEFGLQGFLQANPDKAAKAIMEIYERRYGKKSEVPANPAAPKKEQLISIGGGKSSAGAKKTLPEVMTEIRKMADRIAKEPYLANDSDFLAKKKILDDQFNSLYASSRGQ